MEDVPAPTCFRDKVSVRPVALQGQFTEVGFGGRHQMRALWLNRDTASQAQQMPLPTGDITRSFEKCVRPHKQQSPKQTRARSQSSERFISCARASHTSAERDVKLPGETFL